MLARRISSSVKKESAIGEDRWHCDMSIADIEYLSNQPLTEECCNRTLPGSRNARTSILRFKY